MKVTECLARVNMPFNININKIIELKQYYMSMYRYYSMKMYDEGYISDPTKLNKVEIRKNLLDLGIKGCSSRAGGIRLVSSQVLFCYKINREEQQQKFLELLYYMLLYREYAFSLDTFYETFSLRNIIVGVRLFRGYALSDRGFRFNKATARLLGEDEDDTRTVEVVSLGKFIRNTIYKELGLDPNKEHLLDTRLSIADEIELLEVLFGGYPPNDLNGEYASVLYDWNKNNTTSSRNIIEYCAYVNYFDFMNEIETKYTELEEKGYKVLLVEGYRLYVMRYRNRENIPVGYFCVIDGNDDESSEQIFKNGYTGEGYTEEYLLSEGYIFTGVPVRVKIGRKWINVYDIEQTTVPFNTFFSSYNLDYSFEDTNLVIEKPTDENEAIKNTLSGMLGYLTE